MRLLKPRWNRIARSGGGLAIGLTLHFPVSICDGVSGAEEEEHYRLVTLTISLIAWQIHFDAVYGYLGKWNS